MPNLEETPESRIVKTLVSDGYRPSVMHEIIDTIRSMVSEQKESLACAIVRTVEEGKLREEWSSYEAEPYGLAMAETASSGIEPLLDFGQKHSSDHQRRNWVHAVIGAMFRRHPETKFPPKQRERAVAFLTEGLACGKGKGDPHDSVSWNAAIALGHFGAAARCALPALVSAHDKRRDCQDEVVEIYARTIRWIQEAEKTKCTDVADETPAAGIRKPSQYRSQERIILTRDVRMGGETVPVGTTGIVVQSPSPISQDMVACQLDINTIGRTVHIGYLSLESLENPAAKQFKNLGGEVPVRRTAEGGWLVDIGQAVRLTLKDGRTVEGRIQSCAGRSSQDVDEVTVRGEKFGPDDIKNMVWLR